MSIGHNTKLSTVILRITTDGPQRSHRRIRGCRSSAPLRVQRRDWAGSIGRHRVWYRHVSPNMTVLARRVRRTNREPTCVLFGAQRRATWASVGKPGRATRVHQGATVFDLRTLAGATVEVWRVLRAQRTPTSVPGGCNGRCLEHPSDMWNPSSGCPSDTTAKESACSFGQDEPRSRTTFGFRGSTRTSGFLAACRQSDSSCSDPARTGRSGQPSICGRTFE